MNGVPENISPEPIGFGEYREIRDSEKISCSGEILILYQSSGNCVIGRYDGRSAFLHSGEMMIIGSETEVNVAVAPQGLTLTLKITGSLAQKLLSVYPECENQVISVPESSDLIAKMSETGIPLKEKTLCFHRLLHSADFAKTKSEISVSLKIRDYIEQNAEGKISVKKLSEIFFLSPSQINRICKKELGETPLRLHMRAKIRLAEKWLTDSELKISEIAEKLSFFDSRHFSRVFRQYTGVLPKNYRRDKG